MLCWFIYIISLSHLKRLEDGFVIIGAARHLGGEEGHHLGEVHGTVGLVKHALTNRNSCFSHSAYRRVT